MKLDEQIDDLHNKITNIVEWYHKEFDIPFHAIVGILEEVKQYYMEDHSLIFECEIKADDEEDDDDDEGSA